MCAKRAVEKKVGKVSDDLKEFELFFVEKFQGFLPNEPPPLDAAAAPLPPRSGLRRGRFLLCLCLCVF